MDRKKDIRSREILRRGQRISRLLYDRYLKANDWHPIADPVRRLQHTKILTGRRKYDDDQGHGAE